MSTLIAFILGVAFVFGGAMLVQFLQGAAARKQRKLEAEEEQPAPVVPLEDLTDEIHSLLEQGQNLAALKLVRTHTGWGLKAAQAYVEELQREAIAKVDEAIATPEKPNPLAPNDWQPELIALLKQGKKIPAIKLTREKTGLGLKEAKEYVEEQQCRRGKQQAMDGLKEQKVVDVPAVAVVSLANPRITSQLELIDYMQDCFRQGQKSLAIQEMIKLNGVSQDSATLQVKAWWDRWTDEGLAPNSLPRLYNRPAYASEAELRNALRELLAKGQKIEAIKQTRRHLDMPLKDAKEYVEAMLD